MSDDSTTIAALLRERRSYVARGLDARIRAVDEALEAAGYSGDPPVETTSLSPGERVVRPRGRPRKDSY